MKRLINYNDPDWRLIYKANHFPEMQQSIDRELDSRKSVAIKEYDHSGNLITEVMAGYDDDGFEVWI